MKPTKALYAGSFDPFTVGHLDIVERALLSYETVYIGVGCNPNKNTFFSATERVELIKEVFKNHPKKRRIKVLQYTGSTVDLAMSLDIHVLIRGMRFEDQTFEETNATANQLIASTRNYSLYTELLAQNNNFLKCVSSSAVKTLCDLGEYEAAYRYVPPTIHHALMERYLYPTFATLFSPETDDKKIALAWKKMVSILKTEIYENLSEIAFKLNMFNIYLTHNRCAEIERYKKEILAIIFLSNIADRFVYHKINFAKLENDEEYNAYIDNCKKVYLKLFNVIENKYGKVNFKKEAAIEIDGDYIGSGAYEYSQKIINDLSCLWLGTKDEKLFEQKVALVRSSFHLKYDGDRYFKETLCALREEERIYKIEFFYNLFENSARSNIFKQIMHMNCPR
jgi:pantetheine-phosphate adenylyltransferase